MFLLFSYEYLRIYPNFIFNSKLFSIFQQFSHIRMITEVYFDCSAEKLHIYIIPGSNQITNTALFIIKPDLISHSCRRIRDTKIKKIFFNIMNPKIRIIFTDT